MKATRTRPTSTSPPMVSAWSPTWAAVTWSIWPDRSTLTAEVWAGRCAGLPVGQRTKRGSHECLKPRDRQAALLMSTFGQRMFSGRGTPVGTPRLLVAHDLPGGVTGLGVKPVGAWLSDSVSAWTSSMGV
jgi:hypothetical protein